MEILNQFHGVFWGEGGHLWILGTVFLFLCVGFMGAPLIFWSLLILGSLIGAQVPWPVTYGILALLAVFNIKPIRQLLVTKWVMWAMKKLQFIPAISETERTALEAGVVWIEGELFSGKPNLNKLMEQPYPQLTKEEKAFLDGPVEEFCKMIDDWSIWETRDLPEPAWAHLKKNKFLGMIIPKEYGGLGFSAMAHSEVIMKLCSRSGASCITVMVPNSLGPAELLIHYGTEEQRKHYLPRLAIGEDIPCFALTEPNAGSDAGAIQASGVLFKGDDGKLYIKLNWNKRWITLAAISTVLGLAFRLRDPDNLLGKGEDVGITCALIPTKTQGVVIGRRHDPMGMPFFNCPTQGNNVVVSVDAIVGGLEGAGKGWKMLMECLAAGRGVSLPAQSMGGVKMATQVTTAHASIRKQFGIPIGKFEGIEEPLARIGGFNYLMESFRRYTLGALDLGIKPPVVTAIAKYQATELGRKVINDAMDIMGGAGISRGPRNTMANYYIATPIGITVEGANILTRTLIIFGQGALRAHPYAFKEVNSIEKNDLKGFDDAFWGHIGHVVRNLFRSILLSWTRGWLVFHFENWHVNKYYRRLSWVSASFAIMADIAMGSLGGMLKQKEKITGRFADILSWMYIGTAILRRYKAEGSRKEDLPFVHFCMNHSFYEIQKAFDGIFSNLAVPGLSWFFRDIVRPWSNLNSLAGEPSDQHTHKIATLILSDTEQRVRLTEGIFMPKDPNEQVARLEQTFHVVKRCEKAEKKIKTAIQTGVMAKQKGAAAYQTALDKKVISLEEFNDLQNADRLRYEAIQVDDFSQSEFENHNSYLRFKEEDKKRKVSVV